MATQTKNRSQEDFTLSPDDWQDYAARGTEQVRDMVRDNAGQSMLIALGVGFLIGTALGSSSRSSRWVDRSTAEGIGRRLMSKLEGYVPDAINDRLHG